MFLFYLFLNTYILFKSCKGRVTTRIAHLKFTKLLAYFPLINKKAQNILQENSTHTENTYNIYVHINELS